MQSQACLDYAWREQILRNNIELLQKHELLNNKERHV